MKRWIILLCVVPLVLVGCRQAEPLSSEDIQIEVSVDELAVGDAELVVNVTDTDGNAIEDATINVRGDMDMAGMTPVIRDVEASEAGTFTVPFEWTMGGDWFVDVTVTLPDGTEATERFEYRVEGEMDMDDDMSDMDMEATDEAMEAMNMDDDEMSDMDMEATEEAMDGMDMDGDMPSMNMSGTSAAYMQLTNNGEEDITLISADVVLAGSTELHETVVEDDVARMVEQEDGIIIPSGETVLLQPGGLHVMLLNLEGDFVNGEAADVTLTFDNDETVTIEALIQGFAPEDGDAIEVGDLMITNIWVRPTSMGEMDVTGDDMSDMGMESTEEAMEMEATEEAGE